MRPADLIEICPGENETPQYYLGSTVANEIELVKCYFGETRRLPSVWTATPCLGKVFELRGENSTHAAASVTINLQE
jgi:hypothetical protein